MIWLLRGAFLLQALLGLGLARILFGQATSEPERLTHLALGAIAALLAILVLSPERTDSGIVAVARWFPLLPLAVGLLFYFGLVPFDVLYLHIALGVIAIALVEMAIARRRRTSI